jgi:hypothetical protein
MENGWHEKNGNRIFVAGRDSSGKVAYQNNEGGLVHTLDSKNPFFDGFRAIPECTGWDWKPAPLPSVQVIGQQSGNDSWKGLRLWTVRTLARGDRYVFVAAEKGANDWVELVFDGKGWQIIE